ncbi:MAG: DNA-binding protein WhiA [Clostridia bacterium]|nr:DNA-binding protein WhiA [Clostridia bacterium]
MNNFSSEVKAELVGKEYDSSCCKHAELSAFLRTAGAIGVKGGKVGFEAATDNPVSAKRFVGMIRELYGIEADVSGGADRLNKKSRVIFSHYGDDCLGMLCDLGIVSVDDEGVAIKLGIDGYTVENDCCKAAYISGAFLGGGSVTLPDGDKATSTGYHIEFSFTNYQTATDFCEIMSEMYFLPKLAERKGNYIVYLKTRDEISDLLALMGATRSMLILSELTVEKDMNNMENRRLNCEMSNMTKQIDASVRQIRAVGKIDEIIGLSSLPDGLREVAEIRLANKGMTLSELSAKTGLTKSCINHRLRKIIEIADNL